MNLKKWRLDVVSRNKKSEIGLYLSSNEDGKNENGHRIGDTFESLEEKVYKFIKNKIIYHEIKPGDRIIDKNIAEQLNVSRSLVRQVFATLVKEEFLILVPRSGFYVRKITKKEVKEIYNIRKILESYATELAVSRISASEIDQLEKTFKRAKNDLDQDEVFSFIETDARLHRLLIDNSGNEYLKNMLDKYNNRYVFYRAIDLSRIERAKESYFEHYKIFQAVKEKNEKLAAKLIGEHIENAKNIILKNFDKYTFGKK